MSKPAVGQSAPDIEVLSALGRPVGLQELKARPLLLIFLRHLM